MTRDEWIIKANWLMEKVRETIRTCEEESWQKELESIEEDDIQANQMIDRIPDQIRDAMVKNQRYSLIPLQNKISSHKMDHFHFLMSGDWSIPFVERKELIAKEMRNLAQYEPQYSLVGVDNTVFKYLMWAKLNPLVVRNRDNSWSIRINW